MIIGDKLPVSFYLKEDVKEVAKMLLGKLLVEIEAQVGRPPSGGGKSAEPISLGRFRAARMRGPADLDLFGGRDSNPRQTVYETVALPLSYNEPAHPQDCIGELSVQLLADSDSKMVRKPGFAPGPSRSQREVLLLHHDPD